eukprot:912997-Prymnesium_polylepis.2
MRRLHALALLSCVSALSPTASRQSLGRPPLWNSAPRPVSCVALGDETRAGRRAVRGGARDARATAAVASSALASATAQAGPHLQAAAGDSALDQLCCANVHWHAHHHRVDLRAVARPRRRGRRRDHRSATALQAAAQPSRRPPVRRDRPEAAPHRRLAPRWHRPLRHRRGVHAVPQLLPARLLIGVGSATGSVTGPAATAYTQDVVGKYPEHSGLLLGGILAVGFLAFAIGPALDGAIAGRAGAALPFYLLGALQLLSAPLKALLPETLPASRRRAAGLGELRGACDGILISYRALLADDTQRALLLMK